MKLFRKIIKFFMLYPLSCVVWIVFKFRYGKQSSSFNNVKKFLIRDLGALSLIKELKNTKLPLISKFNIAEHKKSDTVFIFGSGNSLNELTKNDWDLINKHDAIGINFSFLEENIKPNFVFSEFPLDKEYSNLILTNLKENINYSKIPHFFQYANVKRAMYNNKHFFNLILEKLESYYIQMPYYHSIANKKILKDIIKFRRKSKKKSPLIHHLGSVNMVLDFAYLIGYKKIILMGVDMNNYLYFYQDAKYDNNKYAQLLRNSIPKNASKIPHGNSKAHNFNEGFLPGYDYIKLYNDSILKPDDIQLFIGSKSAKLYPELPCYFE